MKFSSQEEYGLRCLLRIGKAEPKGLTIPEISEMEGLSTAHVGKLLRILRLGEFIESERGQNGGYSLARPAGEIFISEVLTALGGRLFEASFCQDHSGVAMICTNSIDCSVRSLWSNIQNMLDKVLSRITLKDLLGKEETVSILVSNYADEAGTNVLKN
jgi:Rrf2 family iron-sulfur cluster assembly transcriptional regulator